MSVKLQIGQILQRFTNNQETVEVKGSTVAECLDDLTKQFPETKQWLFDRNGILMVLILHDSETVYQKDLKRKVKDGDELKLTLIVGGG